MAIVRDRMSTPQPNNMADHQPYLRKVAASSLFNSLTSAVATALLLPLVIRRIGLDAYGLWAVMGIFIGVTSALDFGIWKSLVYLIARGQHSPQNLLSSAGLMCLLGGCVFSVLLFCAMFAGVPVFGQLVESQADLKWWLAGCGCIVVFASLLTNLARGVLEAAYRGHWVNIGYGALTLVQYAIAVAIASRSHDPRMLMAGSAVVYVVILLIHLLWLHSLSALRWQRPSWSTMRAILRFGAGSSLADLPSILIGPLLSYLFVVSASSAGDYGVFDLALRIATLSATTLSMLSTPFFAIVAAAHAGDAQGQTRRMLSDYLRITLSLGVLGWLVFLVIGTALLTLFFTDRPAEIHRAALIMLAGTAAVAASEPVTRMLMGLGRLRDLAKVRFVMLTMAMVAVWLFAEQQPLERFSWAFALGNLASFVGLLWLNHREKWGREAPVPMVTGQRDADAPQGSSRAVASVACGTLRNVE